MIDGDCISAHCVGNLCAAPTCNDGVKNQGESDTDCGGACAPCGANRICTKPSDCATGTQCEDGVCLTGSYTTLVESDLMRKGTAGPSKVASLDIALTPNQRKQIALRMDDEFRGKFTVKALNPTTLASYSTLAIETDYTE